MDAKFYTQISFRCDNAFCGTLSVKGATNFNKYILFGSEQSIVSEKAFNEWCVFYSDLIYGGSEKTTEAGTILQANISADLSLWLLGFYRRCAETYCPVDPDKDGKAPLFNDDDKVTVLHACLEPMTHLLSTFVIGGHITEEQSKQITNYARQATGKSGITFGDIAKHIKSVVGKDVPVTFKVATCQWNPLFI